MEGAVEDIRMSKFLATIRTDVPVEIKMEDLKRVEPDNTKLDEIFTELEFKSFANRVLNKPKRCKQSLQESSIYLAHSLPMVRKSQKREF